MARLRAVFFDSKRSAMNITLKRVSAMLIALCATAAMAQPRPQDHKAHHPDVRASAAAAAASAQPKAAEAAASAASTGMSMHKHMGKHCKEMKKITAIKDPAKRQEAMDAHMKDMQGDDCDMMKDRQAGTSTRSNR